MFRKPGSVFTCLALLTSAGISFAQVPASLSPASSETAKVWMERRAEIEAYLVSAPVLDMEDVPVGVTRPKRARLAPGGPVEYIAWKHVPPGRPYGFWESYKSEIAAYELDQHLGLRMVPPSVERKVNGISGAVIMWLDNMRMWKEVEGNKPVTPRWNRQMVQMKMFDALIGNIDRNSGNALIDADWNVYLIDHSRAFVTSSALPVQFLHVDADLWAKMRALDKDGLTQVLGRRLERRAIDAILTRRDKMAREINKLVAERGAERVFIRE